MAVMAALGTLVLAGSALLVALALRAPAAVLALLAALVAVAPVAAYASVVSYPESLARRIRLASLGGAPEAVNYMAMSMRVAPALDRAVEFAARHTEEPLATRLRQLLWNVYLRTPPDIETAFRRFSKDWGDWQEDLKQAFFAIGAASAEQTGEGLGRSLEKARQVAFEGTKTRIQEYAAGLRGPTTVLFAIGVLLPLMIGSMLPLMSLGGIAPSLATAGRASSGPDSAGIIVVTMDVLFPLGTFAYAYRILGHRPGTGVHMETRTPRLRLRGIAALLLACTAVPVLILLGTPIAVLVALWLLVGTGVFTLVPGLRSLAKRRRTIAAIEAELPDAMFILGSRIAEGAPAETAMQMAADATRGTEVASLLTRIVRQLGTSREGLEEVLFAPDGAMSEIPSRTTRAAFRMVVEVSKKDSATAGKILVETSAYLRDLREVDREIRRDLSSVVDAMQTTSAFFAPLVLGVTCALYGLLSRAFSRLVVLGLPPSAFIAVVGVYLLLVVAIITYFRVGMAWGQDFIETRTQLVRAWPISMAVFTATFLVAQTGLGA